MNTGFDYYYIDSDHVYTELMSEYGTYMPRAKYVLAPSYADGASIFSGSSLAAQLKDAWKTGKDLAPNK
jgi:hypothetical protein